MGGNVHETEFFRFTSWTKIWRFYYGLPVAAPILFSFCARHMASCYRNMYIRIYVCKQVFRVEWLVGLLPQLELLAVFSRKSGHGNMSCKWRRIQKKCMNSLSVSVCPCLNETVCAHTFCMRLHCFDVLSCPDLRLKTASSSSWGSSPMSFLTRNTCFCKRVLDYVCYIQVACVLVYNISIELYYDLLLMFTNVLSFAKFANILSQEHFYAFMQYPEKWLSNQEHH